MKTVAIIPAAGRGKRIKSDINKVYLPLLGKPILAYTIKPFEKSSSIDEIIIVANKEEIEHCRKNVVERYGFQKIKKIVSGGKERQHSVYNGLKNVRQADYITIHDGARPFVTSAIIEKSLDDTMECGASIVAISPKDTIKIGTKKRTRTRKNYFVEKTLDRNKLWIVQTPQTFLYELVLEAYKKAEKEGYLDQDWVTDSASLVEKLDDKVKREFGYRKLKITPGSEENIKITTTKDYLITTKSFLNETHNSIYQKILKTLNLKT